MLLQWRNEPSTRTQFFDSREVERGAHEDWLRRKLAARRTARLFILEWNGTPIGQARIDATGDGCGEISVSLDTGARGQGFGLELIGRATERAADELDLDAVEARIKATNEASRRSFAAAGYAPHSVEEGLVVLRWSRQAL